MRVRLLVLVILSFRLAAPQGPEGTATVRGRVIDAQTGRPLRNVFINLYPQPKLPYTPGIDAEPPKRSAITDAAGGFEVAKLMAAEYAISAGGPAGYLAIEYGVGRAGGPARHLRVADGAHLDITLRAWRAAKIAGHVYDERGRPIIGAQVRVVEKQSDVYGSSTTDDRGAYEIPQLRPGLYAVAVPIFLYNRTLSATPSATRQAPSWVPPLAPYVMDRGLRTVMLVHGAPLPPASEDGRTQIYVTTFAGGASTKETAMFVRLEADEVRDDMDITLPAIRGTRVSGMVIAATDVTGTILTLSPDTTGTLLDADAGGTDFGRIDATAGADGRFIFAAVPPGKYRLTGYRRRPPLTEVTLAGGMPSVAMDDVITADPEDLWLQTTIAIGDADIDDLVVTLSPGTPLTGRIVDEEGGKPGRPDRIRITLGADPRHSFDDKYVPIQPDASFSKRIRPGVYRIMAGGDIEGRVFKTAIVNGQEIGDGPLTIGTEPLRDVQFVFGRFDTTLQGSITEGDGTPSPDATVIAIPADRDKWFRLEESGRAKTTRSATGAYRIEGLPPGDYYVVALHDFLGSPSAQHAASLTGMATRVAVRTGEPVTVNLVARDRE